MRWWVVIEGSTRLVDVGTDQTAGTEADLRLQVNAAHQSEKGVFDQVEAVGTGALDKVESSVDHLYQAGIELELELVVELEVDLDGLSPVSRPRSRVDDSLDYDLPKRMVEVEVTVELAMSAE